MIKLPIICVCGILVLVVSCVSPAPPAQPATTTAQQISSNTPAQTTDFSWHPPLLVPQPRVLSDHDLTISGAKSYKTNLVNAVVQNWHDILDAHPLYNVRNGKVVIEFQLHPDGRVENVRIRSDNVGEREAYICERAIIEGVPYAPWTEKMKATLGSALTMDVVFSY